MERILEPGEMEISGVYKSYGHGNEVLNDVSFKVAKGTFTCLCGPSGCGKTTLINLLAGYDMPDTGYVTLDGEPVREAGWDRLVIFQETALFPRNRYARMRNVFFIPTVKCLQNWLQRCAGRTDSCARSSAARW